MKLKDVQQNCSLHLRYQKPSICTGHKNRTLKVYTAYSSFKTLITQSRCQFIIHYRQRLKLKCWCKFRCAFFRVLNQNIIGARARKFIESKTSSFFSHAESRSHSDTFLTQTLIHDVEILQLEFHAIQSGSGTSESDLDLEQSYSVGLRKSHMRSGDNLSCDFSANPGILTTGGDLRLVFEIVTI